MDALGILPANGLADCYLSVSDSRVFGRADGPFRAHNCRDGGRRGSKRVRNRQRGLCPGDVRGVPPGPGHGRSRLAPPVRERRGGRAPAGGDQWIQGRREGRRSVDSRRPGRRGHPPSSRRLSDQGPRGQARRQHDREPDGPHRHDLSGAARGRAGGAAPAAQRGTRGRRAHRQDLLHSPDRLRAGPGHQAAPGHGPHAGHERRRTPSRGARGHFARPRGGRPAEGRQPRARGPGHQARRYDGLRRLPRRLRGAGGEGAEQPADARRFRRRHHVAHQPRRPRHRGLGAPAHGRPGQHHRGRRHRLPGGVFRRARGAAQGVRDQQGHDDHEHLRPPGHSGRGVGRVSRHGGSPAAG